MLNRSIQFSSPLLVFFFSVEPRHGQKKTPWRDSIPHSLHRKSYALPCYFNSFTNVSRFKSSVTLMHHISSFLNMTSKQPFSGIFFHKNHVSNYSWGICFFAALRSIQSHWKPVSITANKYSKEWNRSPCYSILRLLEKVGVTTFRQLALWISINIKPSLNLHDSS